MRHILPLLVSAAVLLAAPPAFAESKGENLFREGREAAARGDWATACARFDESYSYEASVGALLNLGECNERLGKLAKALGYWRRGLDRMDATDGRRDLANVRIADLEKRTPKIVVRAPGDTRVFIDGQAALPGEPWLVDPGAHRVVVLGAGPDRTLDVTVVEGEVLPVDPSGSQVPTAVASPKAPTPVAPGASPSADEPPGDEVEILVPAVVAYGVAGAGVVTFAVTGALFLGEMSTVDDACDERNRCSPAGLDAGDRGFALGVVNAVALGVAVVGAGVGTAFVIFDADDGAVEAATRGTSLELRGRF